MHTDSSKANGRLRRGSFADGETSPDLFPYQRHVRTFAESQADPGVYSGEDHEGTFAEGQARPDRYAGEDHEGTFAEGQARPTRRRSASDSPRDPRNRYQMLSLRRQPNLQARA